MKKFLALLLAVITLCFAVVAFTACEDLPTDGGNKGENGENVAPVSYKVTEEEWDSALGDLANLITKNGFSLNLTCKASDSSMEEISMFDNVNKVIKIQNDQSIRYIGSDYEYLSYDEGNEWVKLNSRWGDNDYVNMFSYSLLPYVVGLMSVVGVGHFSRAEYKSDKKEYSLFFSKKEIEQFNLFEDATVTVQFNNKNVVKFYIAFETFTIPVEFSDYSTTTVTIPQEVIDSAVSSN